jgi:hypothetical protein
MVDVVDSGAVSRPAARAAQNRARSAPGRPGTPGCRPGRSAPQRQLDLVEQVLELDVAGLVDDQAQRAALAVLAQVDHAIGKSLVLHARHRDQELMRQVDAGRPVACQILFCPAHLAPGPWTNLTRPASSGCAATCVPTTTPRCTMRCACAQVCAFVFDRAILDALPRADRRVEFIRDSAGGAGRRPARAGRGTAWKARPDRAPRAGRRRDAAAGHATGRAGGLCQPRRRSRRPWPATQVRGALAAAGVALHTARTR